MVGWLIRKDKEGDNHSLFLGSILPPAWRNIRISQKTATRIANLQAEMWNYDLLNMKQELRLFDSDIKYFRTV